MTNHEAPARPRRFTDQRGIALQTVIIMVVLLAIAGGIAAVLLNRGSEASQQLEQQNVSVAPYQYGTETLCKAAGLEWAGTTAVAEGANTDRDGDGTDNEQLTNTCYK